MTADGLRQITVGDAGKLFLFCFVPVINLISLGAYLFFIFENVSDYVLWERKEPEITLKEESE